MRRRCGVIAAAACALAVGLVGPRAVAETGGADPAAGQPALWRTFDMIVNFQNLPRTYTCNQLWYEFHGLLLRLGAWPYSINILTYNCSRTPNGDMKSPAAEVRFQLPTFVHGAAVKWASAKAIERTVRLAPGEPKTLQTSDCQLLQQIDQTMLASMPVRIAREHFDCAAQSRRAEKFDVSVSLPMAEKIPTVATTSAPAPH